MASPRPFCKLLVWTAKERAKGVRERERVKLVIQPKVSPHLFIGEVGEESVSMPHDGVYIYRNATRGYKRTLMGSIFTKMPLKPINGPQILFCDP